MGDQLQQAASRPEVFLLYEGGEVAEELRRSLTHVRVGPQVTEIPNGAFSGCGKLVEIEFNEGLQVIGARAFDGCKSLRSVTLPSTVTELGVWAFFSCCSLIKLQLNEGMQVIDDGAFNGCTSLRNVSVPSTVIELGDVVFHGCSGLIKVYLNEGLQVIGEAAFEYCSALRSVTIPSTVTKLGVCAFCDCGNLFEAIFLNGKRLLNQGFFACGIWQEDQGLLNQEALDEMLFYEGRKFAFHGCPLNMVKISISWAVSERMTRLPRECMLSVEERIRSLRHLELLQDGNVLACFPVWDCVPGVDDSDDEIDIEGETYEVQDTNFETARSLYQVLQLIAFHELKESSILIELAMWKSKIEEGGDRACRIAIPGPAKTLLMEYCGFAGFLRPAF